MAKIMNIGLLDVTEINEELAKEVTELKNIGLLIESDNSQALLKDAKRINIGSTLRIPSDIKIDIITKNGLLEIDQDFLEGLSSAVAILVNGKIIFSEDIDLTLLDEKLYRIVLNGMIIAPGRLKGIIESRAVINGITSYYGNDFKYAGDNIRITDRFLKGLKPNSRLAFTKLLLTDTVDLELFDKKIDALQVTDKLILSESNEDLLPFIKDSYRINTVFVPSGNKGIKYFDEDLVIDDITINRLKGESLYVEGDVEIYLSEDTRIEDYISHLICDTLICSKEIYDKTRELVGEDVKIQLIRGRLVKNTSKMELSSVSEEITIKNMGKLIIRDDIDVEGFEKNIVSIINYGVVEADKNILGLVEGKISESNGTVRAIKEEIVKNEEEEQDILYANMGDLKL